MTTKDGTEGFNSFPAFAVVGSETDVTNVRPQGLDDFLNIFELLGREEGVVQQPVICLTVFVLGTQQFDCGIQQLKHFVAAFNALGMMLNVTSGQIGAGQID